MTDSSWQTSKEISSNTGCEWDLRAFTPGVLCTGQCILCSIVLIFKLLVTEHQEVCGIAH